MPVSLCSSTDSSSLLPSPSCPLPNPLQRAVEPELPAAKPVVEAPPRVWQRAARAAGSGQLGLGSGQLGLLHVEVQSVLQIDVELEEPEMSENPTQSFEIHYIFWRRTGP